MTKEELRNLIIENFCEKNRDGLKIIDISELDFSGYFVNISKMKAESLRQDEQQVEDALFQDSQTVGGNLYQDTQKVGGFLYQYRQKVGGFLYQYSQKVKGDLIQNKQQVSGKIIQDYYEEEKSLVDIMEKIKGEKNE